MRPSLTSRCHSSASRSRCRFNRHFGIESEEYRIADTAEEQVPHGYRRGMAQYTIARSWRDADFRISFPKIRSHPIEMALLSLGNVEWVGGRCDEVCPEEAVIYEDAPIAQAAT